MKPTNRIQVNIPEYSPGAYVTEYISAEGVYLRLGSLSESGTISNEEIDNKIRLSGEFAYAEGVTTAIPPTSYLELENASLRQEIEHIKNMVSQIIDKLPQERVIVLREISREDAKQDIKRLFSKGKTHYYSDIAMELRLDLELVVDICNELQEKGEITIDA